MIGFGSQLGGSGPNARRAARCLPTLEHCASRRQSRRGESHWYSGPHAVLGGLALSLLGLAGAADGIDWFCAWLPGPARWLIHALAANLAAGLIGASATLRFVNQRFDREREAEERRVAVAVAPEFRAPIAALVELLAAMMKAAGSASQVQGGSAPRRLEDLTDERYAGSLEWLDASGRVVQPGVPGETNWRFFAMQIVQDVQQELSEYIGRYAAVVDPAFVELLAELQDDAYLVLIARGGEGGIRPGTVPAALLCRHARSRRRCLDRLVEVGNAYAELAGERVLVPAEFMDENAWPQRGSARLPALPAECLSGQ